MEEIKEKIIKKNKLLKKAKLIFREGPFQMKKDTTHTPFGFYVGELGDVINISLDEDNDGNYPISSIQKIKNAQAIVKIQGEEYLIGDEK